MRHSLAPSRLYPSQIERPSRRFDRPLRLSLRWNGHEQAFVHQPTGATLEGLIYAAKKQGRRYRVDHTSTRHCTFVVEP